MENSRTLKSRVLALFLTVLMVFGVLPVTIFAVTPEPNANEEEGPALDAGVDFVAPTLDDIKDKFGDECILFYNDYNALVPGGAFSTKGGIITTSGGGTPDARTTATVVDDGKGGAALHLSANEKGAYFTAYDLWAANEINSGKSFVVATDIMMDATSAGPIALFAFGDRKGVNISPVHIDADGTIYLAWTADGGVSEDVNPPADKLGDAAKAGGALGKLSTTKFTNIAVVFDIAGNTFKVIVDGINKTGDIMLFSEAQLKRIAYATGYGVVQLRLPAFSGRGDSNAKYVFDNSVMYLGNDYIVPEFKLPSVAEIQKVVGANNLMSYYPFDNSNYDGGSVRTGASLVRARGGVATVIDGAAQHKFSSEGKMNFSFYTNGEEQPRRAEDQGKSFVYSFDIKLGEAKNTIPVVFRTKIMVGGTAKYVDVQLVAVDTDGFLTAGGNKLAKLSDTEFANLAVKVDVPNNTYNVYLNGIKLASNYTFLNENQKASLQSYGDTGFALSHIYCAPENKANAGKTLLYYDNVTFYFSDRYVKFGDSEIGAFDSSFDFNFDPANSYNKDAAYWTKMPVKDINAGKNEEFALSSIYRKSFISGASNSMDQSSDYKDFLWKNGYAGLDLAVSVEVQAPASGGAVNFQIRNEMAGVWGHTILRLEGKTLYLDTIRDASQKRKIAEIADVNSGKFTKIDILFDTMGVNAAGDAFESTMYHVYVDGEYVASAVFGNPAYSGPEKVHFDRQTEWAAELGAGAEIPPMGVMYGGISFWEGTASGAYKARNLGVYYYDDDADGDPTNSVRGKNAGLANAKYVVEDGKVYYYEDGVKITDRTTPDGILTIDAEGVVNYNGAPIKSMTKIYTIIDEEFVPVNGVYSGVYVANSLFGETGSTFYYNTSKTRVTDKEAYDIKENNPDLDVTVTGYAFDEKGKGTPLNGFYEVNGGKTYFYANGVKSTGFVETVNGAYFVNDDYTIFTGYKAVEGIMYYFDSENGGKGEIVNGPHKANGTDYNFFIDGELQTGFITAGEDKYFADANGVLLSGIQLDPITGLKRFFYPAGGENEFKMAAGISIIWQGSIITIGSNGVIDEETGKVYGQWTEIDGNLYYSNASGIVVKGIAYIDIDANGKVGGYYYFDAEGVMVKEAFIDVYGTTIYFGVDGKAPTGVVFVSYNAAGFPVTYSVHGVDGEYMNFVDGVLVKGESEAIIDGYKYSFVDGMLVSIEELDEDNPEILVTVIKGLNKNSFYFNANDDGKFDILLTKYPCFVINVYDVTNKNNTFEVAVNPDGKYTLVGTHTYEVVYTQVEHTFSTTASEVVAPTCGADGYSVYACTVEGCLATKTVVNTDRPAHVFETDLSKYNPIVAPTCVKAGVGVTWCKNGCGESHTETLPADPTAHVFGAWVVEPSTCTKGGSKYRECQNECCGAFEHEALPLADHNWGAYTVVKPATCVTTGTEKAECVDCGAETYRNIAIDLNNHYAGNVTRYDDACASSYEVFKVTQASTCLVEGTAIYRCLDCGGFVYNVTIALDPDNHHYIADEEYLAVLDSEGTVIETVKIVNGKIVVNGVEVGDFDPAIGTREQMLANSDMICGYKAEWRIDCKKGCEITSGVIHYDVVEEVTGTFLHQFDLTTLYTTLDPLDPLYGTHYYKCVQCGRAAGVEDHTMIYKDNGNGTHDHYCEKGCVVEGTNNAYGEFGAACELEYKFTDSVHWTECACGAKTAEVAHTMVPGRDDAYHWTECDCGYIVKEAHNLVDVPAKDATCCIPGYNAHKACSCGLTDGFQVIECTPHNITGKYEGDDIGHWQICENKCGENGESCTFQYKKQEHSLVDVPEVAATCTAAGHNAHKICTVCEYKVGYVEYPQLAHTVDGQPYNYDDEQHWQVCKVCGQLAYADHNLGALLEDENGTRQCADCKHIVSHLDETWWAKLGLDRVTVGDAYRYTYGQTKDDIVEIQDNWYYFDANGYLVMLGDSGVNNANVMAANGKFDTIDTMGNTRGIITTAVLDTVNGIFYIDNGELQTGWKNVDGKYYFFNTTLGTELVVADVALGALVKPAANAATIIALNVTGDARILVNVEADGARLLGVVMDGTDAYYYLDGIEGKLYGRIEDNYYNKGNIYFTNNEGKLYSGEWTSVNGVYYSFNADYSVKTWHINDTKEIAGVTIYTDGEGRKITTGWYLTQGVGGKYIENGVMIVASAELTYKVIENTYYTIAADGTAAYYTGWHTDNIHYVASGIVVKDRFEEISGSNYYFDADGLIVKAAAGETIKVVIGTWVYSIDANGVATQYVVDDVNSSVWVYFLTDGILDVNAKGYYTSTGLIAGQAIVIDTATYVFDANGKLVTSKDNYECNGVVYVIDAEGKATVKDDDDGE